MSIRFTAAGDMSIQKRLPRYYDGFNKVKDFILRGNVRFVNMETTVNENCFAAKNSGGTWLRTSEAVLRDTLEYGFNVTTAANNHCMDFAYDGFLQTLGALDSAGYIHAGAGRNLSEASAPAYVDTPSGRTALIACSTSYPEGAEAGEQSRRLPGRPGINALHVERTVTVSADDLAVLRRIASETKLNAERDIIRREGYLPALPEDKTELDTLSFRAGDLPGVCRKIADADMKRLELSMDEARMMADHIIVSIHSHQIEGDGKETPPLFLIDLAHRLIELGAHAVIGHGPHLLRPLEIYKGRPIFYSLGNFVMQLENLEYAPEDFYAKFEIGSDAGIYEALRRRTKDFTVGLQYQRVMTESVLPYFEFDGDQLTRLEVLPLTLGFGMKHPAFGWPRPAENGSGILERFAEMSKPFGADMTLDGGVCTLKL